MDARRDFIKDMNSKKSYFGRAISISNQNIPESLVRDVEKQLNSINQKILEELPGILSWCIEGLKRLVANNYQCMRSQEADKLMLEYRKDILPVFSFIVVKT